MAIIVVGSGVILDDICIFLCLQMINFIFYVWYPAV